MGAREQLREAIAVANSSNNEGYRVEAKVDAVIAFILGDAAGEEASTSMPAAEPVADDYTGPEADDTNNAERVGEPTKADETRHSGAPQYDVLPESPKLRAMTVADLQTLAERRGVTLPEGAKKADIISALTGEEPS